MGFNRATVSDMLFEYSVVSSRYNITASRWSQTAEFALQQAQRSLGLQGLYKAFAPEKVRETVQLREAECEYLDGWYSVTADVHVDAQRFE